MPMAFRERLHRTRETLNLMAVKFVPRRLRYWVTLCEIGKATMTSKNVPGTPLDEILKNLEAAKNG